MASSLLALGRAVGLENVAQMRALIRGFNQTGAGVAHIKLDSKSIDTFQKMLTKMSPESTQAFSAARMHFPESFAQGVEHFIDIVAKKFGKCSGKVALSSVSKNGKNIVAKSNAKLLGNNVGGRVIANSNIGQKVSFAIDTTVSRYGKQTAGTLQTFANGVNYTENAGVSKLVADVKNAGPIRNLKANIMAPKDYVDAIFKNV